MTIRSKNTPVAVALRWDGKSAPQVTAKGSGEIAEKILEVAATNHVPLRQDALLAEVLCKVNIGQEIPPALFRAVAEVIAFAYRLRDLKLPAER